MKKLIPVLLLISMLLFATPVLASPTTTELTGTVTPASYVTIAGGECRISDLGEGLIMITGYTSTSYAVDRIGLTLYLQYYSSGQWYTVNSYQYTDYSSSYVSGTQYLSVSKGYYYRVIADHTSVDGGINEKAQSYSQSVYIY
ncbi:hypothetical protein JCM15765_31580 [Paradesulfitobacterium aromaticivorans]